MALTVKRVKSKDDGRTVQIEAIRAGSSEKVTYTVSEGTYREIGCPLSGEILYGDDLECIMREDEQRRAFKKALSILSYADNNKRTLYAKLIRAGFSQEAAENAVTEAVRLGYINEDHQLERLVSALAQRNLYGPKRIEAKLAHAGYDISKIRHAIASSIESGEVDFSESKRRLIEKRLGENYTYEEKMKLLYRYGYLND